MLTCGQGGKLERGGSDVWVADEVWGARDARWIRPSATLVLAEAPCLRPVSVLHFGVWR